MSRSVMLAAALACAVAVRAEAQAARDPFCWRGQPADACGTILLTELGGGISTTQPARRPPWNVSWEVGALHNVSSRVAVGGTAFLSLDDEERLLLGLKPRLRYWLGRDVGLDVAPGVVLANVSSGFYRASLPAFTGHVGVVWKDWAGVMLQLEHIENDPVPEFEYPSTTLYVGLRLGSWAGVAGGLATGALAVISETVSD